MFDFHDETLLCMLDPYYLLTHQHTGLCVCAREQCLLRLSFPHTFMFSTLYRRVLLPAVERVGSGDAVLEGVL